MPEQISGDVAWAIADLSARLPFLVVRRDYYEGRHRSMLPPGRSITNPHLRELLEDLSDNLCDDVVDEPVGRLSITNWSGTSQGVGQTAKEWWEAVKGPARLRETFRNAGMAGDGFAMVQKDRAGAVRLYVQQPEQMAVRYSTENPDEIEVAAKVWKDGKRYRLNLYYPDEADGGARLERWATRGVGADGGLPQAKAFQPLQDQGVEAVEASPDWAGTGQFPIFHFPADEVGRYGRSVLTDVIRLNDVLNKSVVDLVLAMEDVALPQRYATGVQSEIDPETGQEKPLFRKSRGDQMLRTASTEAAFGQFAGADLGQFLDVQRSYRLEIARKGYLPLHSVSLDAGGNPTATGILVGEGRQVKRVKTWQQDWKATALALMAYALRLGGLSTTAPEDLDLEWAPAETRDERALVETVGLKVDLGLPKRQALLELGYDEDDVVEWMDEAQQQADAISGGRMSQPGAGLPQTGLPSPQAPPGAPAVAVPGV